MNYYIKYHSRDSAVPVFADISLYSGEEQKDSLLEKALFYLLFLIIIIFIWLHVKETDINRVNQIDSPLVLLPEIIKPEKKILKPEEKKYYRPPEKKEPEKIKKTLKEHIPEKKKYKVETIKKKKIESDKILNKSIIARKDVSRPTAAENLKFKEIDVSKIEPLRSVKNKNIKTGKSLIADNKKNYSAKPVNQLKINEKKDYSEKFSALTVNEKKINKKQKSFKNSLEPEHEKIFKPDLNMEKVKFHAVLNKNNISSLSADIRENKGPVYKSSYSANGKSLSLSNTEIKEIKSLGKTENKASSFIRQRDQRTLSAQSAPISGDIGHSEKKNKFYTKEYASTTQAKKIYTEKTTSQEVFKEKINIREKVIISSQIEGENKRIDNLRFMILNKIDKFINIDKKLCCKINKYKCEIKVTGLKDKKIYISFDPDGKIPFEVLSKLERKIPEGLKPCTDL